MDCLRQADSVGLGVCTISKEMHVCLLVNLVFYMTDKHSGRPRQTQAEKSMDCLQQ